MLLYGVRIPRRYEDFFRPEALAALRETLQGEEKLLVLGRGALCETLRGAYGTRVWVDITPRTAALNYKYGKAHNFGEPAALPFGAMMRRNYYVDFELAVELRWTLIRQGALDWYMTADDMGHPSLLPYGELCGLFDELRAKPLRCRPVYLEGVWGGFYIKRLRNLPREMKNCAWVFDMIPMEVSLAAVWPGHEIEVPFFTFVQQQGEKLLGKPAYDAFGGYFPVRFNYDDTFHSSGNMSIQCHPDAEWVVKQHGELGRQDESYYVCVAGQDACTYLGFEEENSCEEFFAAAEKAQETRRNHRLQALRPCGAFQAGHPGDDSRGHHPRQRAQPGDPGNRQPYRGLVYLQALRLPAHRPADGIATAHSLGRGAQGDPSRAHGRMGNGKSGDHGGVKRQGEGYVERTVGEHELLYFALHTETFDRVITDDTRDRFHVLALTEGEQVRVESQADPARHFVANYLDVIVVPADFGPYRIVNLGQGPVTVHKTCLKDSFETCAR